MTPNPQSRIAQTRAVWAVRRALAPAALELPGRVAALTEENARLRDLAQALEQRLGDAEGRIAAAGTRAADAEARLADAEARAADAERRTAALEEQLAELRDGLHESRRLNLRVAELTDLVTELVLPLHDREIDPAVLTRLRPDTL